MLHAHLVRATRVGLLSLLLRSAAEAGAIEATDLQRGLDVLRERLLAIHPDPFARIAPDAFDAEFADLRMRLPGRDADAALVRMMRLVTLLRDGHTSVSAAPKPAPLHRSPNEDHRMEPPHFPAPRRPRRPPEQLGPPLTYSAND